MAQGEIKLDCRYHFLMSLYFPCFLMLSAFPKVLLVFLDSFLLPCYWYSEELCNPVCDAAAVSGSVSRALQILSFLDMRQLLIGEAVRSIS